MNTQRSTVQTKFKDKIEEDYEQKIISLLEPVVGAGRVMAKVNVILDFTKKILKRKFIVQKEVLDLNKLLKIHQMLQGLEIIQVELQELIIIFNHHNS